MARSEVSYTYDADTAFRAPGSAPITASGEIGTFTLDKMVNARSGDQKNKLGAEFYDVVITVEASDAGEADEVYTFDVEVQGAGGANAVVAGALATPRGVPGQYVIKLDGHTLEKLSGSADRVELALNLTVAGTTPSITFGAWVAYGAGL